MNLSVFQGCIFSHFYFLGFASLYLKSGGSMIAFCWLLVACVGSLWLWCAFGGFWLDFVGFWFLVAFVGFGFWRTLAFRGFFHCHCHHHHHHHHHHRRRGHHRMRLQGWSSRVIIFECVDAGATLGQHLVYHIYIDTGVWRQVLGHRCEGGGGTVAA